MSGRRSSSGLNFAFLWESIGPSHHDRLRAVANAGHGVTAIELFARSAVYQWEDGPEPIGYQVISLAPDRASVSTFELARRIVDSCSRSDAVFLCHYNEPAVFLAARKLRVMGKAVFTMIDSKTDDRVRNPLLDIPKRIMLSPYHGALVAGERSARYVQSLGVAAERIAWHYNTLDIASLSVLTAGMAASKFSARPFLIVARLIPEKNLCAALEAYSLYRKSGGKRRLSVIGEGPERDRLQAQARRLKISDATEWHGSRSRAEVAASMRQALALLLPSTSETYGLVVIEALAQALPVIVSARAGVVDLPVTNGKEGILIDPPSIAEIEQAMRILDCGETEWKVWSDAASAAAGRADARHFAASVEQLVGLEQ